MNTTLNFPMSTSLQSRNGRTRLLAWLGLCAAAALAPAASAQNAAFSYQGKLDEGGRPATGLYEMTFSLHGTANFGVPLAVLPPLLTPVTNGLFTALLDFGPTHFTGAARWLQVSVRSNGVPTAPVALLPRTSLGSAPQATFASKAASVSDGVIGSAQIASGNVVKSLNGLKDDVVLAVGSNLSLAANGNVLTLSAPGLGSGGAFTLSGTTAYYNGGNVGIGTAAPRFKLDVAGDAGASGDLIVGHNLRIGSAATEAELGEFTVGNINRFVPPATFFTLPPRLAVKQNGFVGIGTGAPSEKLHVNGAFVRVEGARGEAAYLGGDGAGGDVQIGSMNPDVSTVVAWNTASGSMMNVACKDLAAAGEADIYGTFLTVEGAGGEQAYLGGDGVGGEVHLGSRNPYVSSVAVYNQSSGRYMHVYVGALTILGGADLAEPFEVSESRLEPGTVVVIDEANPGRLKRSECAYDTRVAGIISGANGVNPGIALQQKGALEGGQNVALTGRVYVKADARYGAIAPGDLLTSSETPGHAMRAGDRERAPGAILGKAMSRLEQGTGFVLVLVSLQ